MMYDVGDRVTVTTELRDTSGTLTDATVTLSVRRPDLTSFSPTVGSNGGTGLYAASFSADQVGIYLYKWTAAGALAAVESGQITVQDSQRVLVAGLDEFRAQLDRADFSGDAELRLYLEAATNQIEWLIGPLTPTVITERVVGGNRIALRRTPVISVTSIAPVFDNVLQTPLDASLYAVDNVTGDIRLMLWHTWGNNWWDYEIQYTVGRTTIPADIKLAGLIIAQHLWAVQNGRWTINAPTDDQLAVSAGAPFSIPYRALELLRPYIGTATIGGIA